MEQIYQKKTVHGTSGKRLGVNPSLKGRRTVPGGRFVCMNFGIDEKGRYLGNTGGHSMFDKFNQHWKAQLDQGTITDEEYTNATFAQHYRTVEEFCAPFNDKMSKISKAGLRLLSCSTKLTRCPYREAYEKNIHSMSKKILLIVLFQLLEVGQRQSFALLY